MYFVLWMAVSILLNVIQKLCSKIKSQTAACNVKHCISVSFHFYSSFACSLFLSSSLFLTFSFAIFCVPQFSFVLQCHRLWILWYVIRLFEFSLPFPCPSAHLQFFISRSNALSFSDICVFFDRYPFYFPSFFSSIRLFIRFRKLIVRNRTVARESILSLCRLSICLLLAAKSLSKRLKTDTECLFNNFYLLFYNALISMNADQK